MECVKSDTYLGDIISFDGSNTENIKQRISKGNGIIAQIKTILERVSLGAHFFKIAFLLRESLLLNGILYNSETWYGLKKAEIEEMENLDKDFIRSLFEVPFTVPVSSLFLETGCVSINTIIKARRINFLHYMLKLEEDEMLLKFFMVQWEQGRAGDWSEEVKKDLTDFGIPQDLQFIRSKSKLVFNKLVKNKARQFELNRLVELKNSRNSSKMKDLFYIELKMQEYLELKDMSASQAKALFKFRTRMAPFGENFRGGEKTVLCPLCKKHPDSQEESFSCVQVNRLVTVRGSYKEIFRTKFSPELVQTVYNIYNFREEYRKLG